MKNIIRALIIVFVSFVFVIQPRAEEYHFGTTKQGANLKQTAAGCSPASAYSWLDINNVKARINAGGDMWWDLDGLAKYYVPADGAASSIFAGALWIGGLDINNQLKLAAQRFRRDGVDFWTGPLTVDGTASVDESVCAEYDRFFKITRAEVDEFLAHTDPDEGFFIPSDDYVIPPAILNWPAHGDVSKGQSYYLAPFYDVLGDGEYDPFAGDYPYYDISNELCHSDVPTPGEEIEGIVTGGILADQVIKGDQTLWWVFNDKGNVHGDAAGAAIGLEIRAQAFAFATNDVINNMTFYSYEIINRSTFELTETYFSPWIDTDLGFAEDDFVGCDVGRGLGYCYNGTAEDGSGQLNSYGMQPPAVGVDFFQGPYMDSDDYDNPSFDGDSTAGASFGGSCDIVTQNGDPVSMTYIKEGAYVTEPNIARSAAINGINFGNGIVDDERYGMRRFVYHNNSSGDLGDPDNAPQYYNYLKGIWKDNTIMQYGGTGHIPGAGTVGPECDFMFPGDSDPCNWGTSGLPPNGGFNQDGFYWTEETGDDGSPNPPGDRRFMQSAGPFTLKSGAVNYITVGIPWARAQSGGPWASVELLRVVDDKCQALFDNCFKVIDGPTAPDLSFVELDRKLIVYITNSTTSNNYLEKYTEFDPNIIQPLPGSNPPVPSDAIYRFEGYQIFQLNGATVSVDNLNNPDLVRLVAQFDVKNGITKIVNYDYNDNIGANVPVVMVDGGDNGINHSFEITQDAFATNDIRLVNNKQYYFLALAYAYNNFLEFGMNFPNSSGQTQPYLSGRKNIKSYTSMPHLTINGTVLNSDYGNSPQITRIAGNGNGGMTLDFTQETIDEIMAKQPSDSLNIFGSPDYPISYNPVYEANAGPLNIKVIDPLSVVDASFVWWMDTLVRVKINNVTNNPAVAGDTTSKLVGNWKLKDELTGDVYLSDTTIQTEYEQLFIDLGFSITMEQPFMPGPIELGKIDVGSAANPNWQPYYEIFASNNGLLESSITYADSSKRWLSGVTDIDVPESPLNWIRSGTYKDSETTNDWNMGSAQVNPWDPNSVYEKILSGTWAPYAMTSYGGGKSGIIPQNEVGPSFSKSSKTNSKLENISSIDIVITPDKDKWTRCPVLEAGFYSELAEGNSKQFFKRSAASVDKDGNFAILGSGSSNNPNDANYISDNGMGWFPGYAINIETGERLNMMFAEDSYLVDQNGRDMLFNPTSRNLDLDDQFFDKNIWSGEGANIKAVLGGKHYVYVQDHRNSALVNGSDTLYLFSMPAYDAGRYSSNVLDTLDNLFFDNGKSYFYASIMYTGIPMGVVGQEWLSNEAKIKIRISKPYQSGYSSLPVDTIYPGMDINNFFPMYQFSTAGLSTQYNISEKQQTDLDAISVVPNPYYAYSAYEHNSLDNRVKITNLPEKCTITIYNISGNKIKQFKKDTPETTIEWDLKNFASVPIAGGIYYFHIKSEQGDRVIKWFSITRIPDLNTF